MNIIEYIMPENIIAIGIISFLVAIFLTWAVILVWNSISLLKKKSTIKSLSDITQLSNSLIQIVTEKQQNENQPKKTGAKKKDVEEVPVPGPSFIEQGETAFSSFCKSKGINESGKIAKHIRTIFRAGLEDSRLDIGELIKYTNQEIFRRNNLLKSLLASFLVLGLLGTLIGLADSLTGLSPVLGKGVTDGTTAELAGGLKKLYEYLKTAFAPSIWGVGTTVLGVLIYSFYLSAICTPLKNTLQRLTLSVWVPKLFLTRSQRWLGTLKFGEEQIQRNLEAINNVIEMQKTIRPDVEELAEKLQNSNLTLGKMNESAAELQNFTSSFTDGVTKLSSFQDHLHNLYQKMIQESEGFQSRVQSSIDNSQTFQDEANSAFERQSEQLKNSYEILNRYENTYITHRHQIDANIEKVLEAAQKSYESLAERNKEVIETIGGPLTASLQDLQCSIRKDLEDIVTRFNSFDAPFTEAAERVANTVDNFNQRTTTVSNELITQFAAYSEKSDNSQKEIMEKIDGFANHLSETNRNLADRSGILATGVTSLSEKIGLFSNSLSQVQNLGQNLTTFSSSVNDLQKAVKLLEVSFQKRDESVESLKPLSELSSHMEALIGQLKENSQAQEQQNLLVAKNVDQMAGAVQFLAKSMEQMGMKKLAKEYSDKVNIEPLYNHQKNGPWSFFRRLFGNDKSQSGRM